MPSAILHAGATVECPHKPSAAQAKGSSARVKVDGKQVATLLHGWLVTTCALSASSSTFCINGQFTSGATRVKVEGNLVATLSSVGKIEETQSPLLPVRAQTRVLAD